MTLVVLRADLHIPQGKTWSSTIPVRNADNTLTDLTGYTAKIQARDFYDPDALLYEWSTTAGNLTLGTGQAVLSVAAATSSAWTWTFGRWDLKLTSPSGTVPPLIAGFVFVEPQTTT